VADEHIEAFDRMRDHWYWRPGWRVGRSFYTWHLTFSSAADVHRLAGQYRAQLADLPGLDPIPDRWLHLTMQGVGFTDEVSPADAAKIAEAVQERCRALSPFPVTLGPPVIDPEVVRLKVSPAAPVAELRATIRAAIADVWGADNVPEQEAGFTPHVSVAYSNATGHAQPIFEAVAADQPAPATAQINEAQLIILNRDHREYQWTEFGAATLGG
jgi:2'-5' RNA ligase